MPAVTNTVLDPAGNPVAGAVVRITLVVSTTTKVPGYLAASDIINPVTVTTDATGQWTATLTGNAAITPANTYYQVSESGYLTSIVVPASGGPYTLSQLVVSPPTPSPAGITGVQVAADGTVAGVRPEINLVSGANVAVTAVDNPGAGRVDVTITSSGGGGGGIPSSTVVSETSFGQAASVGAATTYSRGDHTHGSPPLTSATPAAETPGAAGAAGTATSPARADHVHALPAFGTTAGTFAQGSDSRITGALQAANNLSDVANPATARTNLGIADTLPFAYTGTATVTTGVLRWYNRTGRTLTILGCWVSAGTAPTGAALIGDLKKNGTTCYPTSAKPQVAAGTNGGVLAVPDVTTVADGDYLTADITQVGSTTAGADVVLGVVYR